MRRWTATAFCSIVCAAAFCLFPDAHAANVPIPHGTVDLVAESQSIAPAQTFDLALHFQLEKGWHIYWVNPGDSGQPPRITWKLPQGIAAGEIEWPAPHRLGTSPTIVDFGYTDDVTLLVPMRAGQGLSTQQVAQVGAELRVLVCREICVPGKAQLAISIPVKTEQGSGDPATRDLFVSARKSLPLPAPAAWKFTATDAKDSFILRANLGRQINEATFFPLAESQINNAAPQKAISVATGFELTLQKSDELLKPIARLKGVLVLSGGQAFSIDTAIARAGTAKQR